VFDMPISTRELFARVIKCEAEGEGLNGMRAVATVIMNRVHVSGGQYLRTNQGSLRKVIMEPGEFTCLLERIRGVPNPQNVWNMRPDKIHYDVADWALAGNKLSGAAESLWYFNPYRPYCQRYFPINRSGVYFNRVALHCFYSPTPRYYKT
jgi:N-acetylmuramoyl-L-alanine amidase